MLIKLIGDPPSPFTGVSFSSYPAYVPSSASLLLFIYPLVWISDLILIAFIYS
jgi:hypothetical protein